MNSTVNKYKTPILSAVGVIFNTQNEILITERKVAPYIGKWVMPGGKVDFGETLERAVLREISEEVGLKGKVKDLIDYKESLPGDKNANRHYVIFYFRVEVKNQKLTINSEEVGKVAWVSENTYMNYELALKTQEILEQIFHG